MIINLMTFIYYSADKWIARRNEKANECNHRRRVPEATLLWLAAAGGSIGAFLSMQIFHHKTKHRKFTILVPFLSLIQTVATGYIVYLILF